MTNTPRSGALGRGLAELTDEAARADTPLALTSERGFFHVPVEAIAAPAGGKAVAADAGLIASVKAHGILQPVLLRKTAEGYELIDGRRRLDAARAAGQRSVPAIVWTDAAVDNRTLAGEANRHRRLPLHAGGWTGSALSRAALLALLLFVMVAGGFFGLRMADLRSRPVADESATAVAEHAVPAAVQAPTPAPVSPATPEVQKPERAAAEPVWPARLAGDGIGVAFTNGQAVITFAEPVFSSYATLADAGAARLRELAGRIAAVGEPLTVTICGHTDPTPVRAGGRYADNFELGMDRAVSAMFFLRYQAGLTNTLLSARSLAEADPPFPNDTPESSRRNRTVTLRVRSATP